MSSSDSVADLLVDLQGAFDAIGVRWFLFGAQAAILYGVARLSADVDVTVDLGGALDRLLRSNPREDRSPSESDS